MEKLFEYIAKEWNVVSQAPFAFLILAAIMFGLAYLAAKKIKQTPIFNFEK